MTGGAFAANTRGLDHYREFGYKRQLRADPQAVDADWRSPAWLHAPYRFNRAIVHDGDLPHLSTPIEHLPEGTKRVILGFNLFTHDVGPMCARAPEHSEKFNNTVKLYQTMAGLNRNPANKNKEKLTLDAVKKNKGLARMLILLANKKKELDAIKTAQATPEERASGEGV